jgi:hypothetical protein
VVGTTNEEAPLPTVPAPKIMAALLLPIIATLAVLGATKSLSEAPESPPTARNYRVAVTVPPTTTMGWSWPQDMYNPELNLRFALKLWQGSGWRPWGF